MRRNEIEVGRIYTSLATGMVVLATYIYVPWQWTYQRLCGKENSEKCFIVGEVNMLRIPGTTRYDQHACLPIIKAGPLEAILVIFGRRASIFFESSWKNIKNDTTFVCMRSGDHLGDAKMSKKGASLRRI